MLRPTITVYTTPDLPRDLLSISPFARDERCDTHQIVVSESRDAVILKTQELHRANITEGAPADGSDDEPGTEFYVYDWDHLFDNASGKWVGFTCKDKEPSVA